MRFLDCMYRTNSKNGANPRNQPFKGEKVKKWPKMSQTMVRVQNFQGGPYNPKFTVSGLKYSQHPYNFSTRMNF